jgi:hypothetical protein
MDCCVTRVGETRRVGEWESGRKTQVKLVFLPLPDLLHLLVDNQVEHVHDLRPQIVLPLEPLQPFRDS